MVCTYEWDVTSINETFINGYPHNVLKIQKFLFIAYVCREINK